MFKKKLDIAIVITIAVTAIALCFINISTVKQKQKLETQLKLIREELQETQEDRDFYQDKYYKYLELSKELENQIGVFNE